MPTPFNLTLTLHPSVQVKTPREYFDSYEICG